MQSQGNLGVHGGRWEGSVGEIGVSGDFTAQECSFWDVGGPYQAGEGAGAQQQAGAALVLADLLQCPLTWAAPCRGIG